jgi:hypothetical protein
MIRETEDTRRAEDAIAIDFAKAWRISFVRRQLLDAIDYDIFGAERRIGLAETKARDHDFGQFPSVLLSVNKLEAGINEAQAHGLAFFLCFGFRAQRWWTEPAQHIGRVRLDIKGRNDRNDRRDVNLVAYIPCDCWRQLKT